MGSAEKRPRHPPVGPEEISLCGRRRKRTSFGSTGFEGDCHINIKILEFLPGKTRKQINDKHVHLQLTIKSAPPADGSDDPEAMPTPNDVDTFDPTLRRFGASSSEHRDHFPGATRGARVGWGAITTKGRSVRCFVTLNERLARLATENSEQVVNDILDDLVSVLLGDEAEHALKPNIKSGRKRNHNNHNNRSRFKYTRCHEVYCKRPRKLDMAQTTTFSKIEPPPILSKIRKLYSILKHSGIGRLWQPAVEVKELLAPIRQEEIIRRLGRMKSSTGMDLDRIGKAHLRKP